ncbi:MAG: nicotinate-nucleotide--dimethylbenzimidazole phosphoribosyltransferase [Anaerolineae bacterium]|nr:nicotinate-nucleotide--dimethylbenzimidazole phosphoribosyltransferase [Anaerolineae bacterium]
MLTLPNIPQIDADAAEAACRRQARLTKPTGSLGALETLSIQLAGIRAKNRPAVTRKAVIVMAGDHGVTLEGVSAYPSEVTPQMVINFLNGGAAINVLARQAGARVVVVDIGVKSDFEAQPGLIQRKVRRGTANMALGPAMTRAEAETAIQVGIDVVNDEIKQGLDLVATGEMGIGNTTPSAAITAVLCGLPVGSVTGRGTGVDDAALSRKIEVIEKAIAVNRPDAHDALDVLCKVGGLEIAGLAGVMIGAAAQRVPVVIDGFISGAAALIAVGLCPAVQPYLIASHQSVEIGHMAIINKLGLRAIFNLDLRLGEGSGAALAFHVIEAACRTLDEMATFDEAGVSDKQE